MRKYADGHAIRLAPIKLGARTCKTKKRRISSRLGAHRPSDSDLLGALGGGMADSPKEPNIPMTPARAVLRLIAVRLQYHVGVHVLQILVRKR